MIIESGGAIPDSYMNHLVDDCNAAERLDYETKVDVVEVKKKPLSSQSLPPAKASRKKTATSLKRKPR